jgi:hypothetical protein
MLSVWIPGRLVERGNAEHLNRGDIPCLGARIVSYMNDCFLHSNPKSFDEGTCSECVRVGTTHHNKGSHE